MREPARVSGEESAFAKSVAANRTHGLLGEFWGFLRHNKKWWLAPIIIVILAMTLLVVVSGSAAAPFIYTLF